MKKFFSAIIAGALIATTLFGSVSTPVNASTPEKQISLFRFFEAGDDKDATMYANGDWAKQNVSYTPLWKTTEDNAFVEPNYLRTSEGEVAYCISPGKDVPSSVKQDGTASIEQYRLMKNGYPSKTGSDYNISDVELEWATTVAMKSISGDSYELDDFENGVLAPIYESETENAAKIKNVVVSLINSSNSSDISEFDKFKFAEIESSVVEDGDNYKVGPYKIDTNLKGTTSVELSGAPSSASITKTGDEYFVIVPVKDITKETTFSLIANNTNKVLSANTYKPNSSNEQTIFVYANEKAEISTDITITPSQKGIIKISKVDKSGNPIANVEFSVLDSNGNEIEKITTDSNGEATSSKLSLGKYSVKETKAADGYILKDEAVEVQLVGDSLLVEVGKTIVNEKNSVTITKLEKGTTKGLKDATIDIVNSNNKVVATGTTDKDGKIVLEGIPAGTYKIIETKAPEGYKLPEKAVEFSIDAYGKVTGTTTIENELIKVTLTKVDKDDNSKLLEGAKIEVKDSNGKSVFVGKTDSKGSITVEGLKPGKYTAVETVPPSGYTLNDKPIEFSVDEYGKVTGTTKIENKITVVTITKKDSSSGNVLSGAKILIKDENGKEVFTGTTNDKGIIEIKGLAPGLYAYYEVEAPEGYVKTNEKSSFTINNKGEDLDLTLLNEKLNLTSGTTSNKNNNSTGSSSNETIKTGVEDTTTNNMPFVILGITLLGSAGFVFYRKKQIKA